MSGTVYAVASAKGGVGKTTTSINLAAATAMASEQSVVAVDLDLAMANFLDFLSLDLDPGVDPTLHDVLAGEVSVPDATYEAPGGFHVVPSGPELQGYAATDPTRLRDVIATLRQEYDLTIIDTAAGVSYETILPLGLADGVVLVSTPRLAAVRDTAKTKTLAERVEATVVGVIFARSGTGSAPSLERLAEYLDVDLLGHIPEEDVIPASQDAGKPVLVHDFASNAAKAYWDAAKKLAGISGRLHIDSEATEPALQSDSPPSSPS